MLFEWLFPMKDMRTPDIYIIGFQEIVDLNAKNVMLSSNTNKVDFWKNLLLKHFKEIDNYVMIKTLDLVGICLVVFVKESIKENIKNIDSLIVRTGLLGTIGNKGSCLLRFNYNDTSVAIANCHLSAGASNVSARITEISEIFNRTYPIKNLRFKDHDIQYIFGDLNFRIDLDFSTCKQMISSGSLSSLKAYDQLNKAKSVSTTLIELDEGSLNFDPTYKYVMGSSEYDSKKKRVPSWCDRILFKKNKHIEVIDYNRVDYLISDHKPVYGLFKITTTKIDHYVKNQIIKEIRESVGGNIMAITDNHYSDITSKFYFLLISRSN
jgi:synaptojanin